MTEQNPGRPPTEEELRAAYEAELKRLTVDDVVLQTVVSLVNLGGRKAGLAPGTEDERDLAQVGLAIEAVRVMLPLVEEQLGPDASRIRDALSQLQMAYAQLSREAGAPGEAGPHPGDQPAEKPADQAEGPGPAQSSGRLWVPGQ
jgi:hypothetical protein